MSSVLLTSIPDDVLLALVPFATIPSPIIPYTTSRLNVSYSMVFKYGSLFRHSLIPLSATCRRLRSIYEPVIFERLSVSHLHGHPERCSRVLSHVKILTVQLGLEPDELETILQYTPFVREIESYRPRDPMIPVICRVTSLESVNLCNVSTPEDASPLLVAFHLRSFCLTSTSRFAYAAWEDGLSEGERILVRAVLDQCRDTLETLVLPGDSVKLSALAAERWPRLQELTLFALSPSLDVPVLEVLGKMPKLRFFSWTVVHPMDAQAPRLIWPPSAAAPTGFEFEPERLERLAVSYPNPADVIFSHLSDALTELALRDTPRYYHRVRRYYAAPILDWHGALRIMRTVPVARLRRLELVVRDASGGALHEAEAQLYTLLASGCPALRFLELHRYSEESTATSPVPVAIISAALSALPALRELRLNLDFPEARRARPLAAEFINYTSFVEAQAHVVVRAAPRLEHVAFIIENLDHQRLWQYYTVRRAHAGGVATLEAHDDGFASESLDLDWV